MMAGQSERLFAGYPIVRGGIRRDGKDIPSIAALLYMECKLERTKERGFELVATSGNVEVNPFALDLLGATREERQAVLEGLETLEDLNEVEAESRRIEIRLDFLRSLGLLEEHVQINPESMGSISGDRQGLANHAVIFAGERAATTRQLLQDLEELLDRPGEELRKGPLGVLLGAREASLVPPPQPQPSIVPTNLSQERAVTTALTAEFATVTGPPGTGKSQVLVNAVSASVIGRRTVLFASKNNQAVDVVFERLAAISNEAIPLRAGATRYRGELARRMNEALARPRVSDLPLAATRARWADISTKLSPLYRVEGERDQLLRALAEEEKRYEEIAREVPEYLIGEARLADSDFLERLAHLRTSCHKAQKRGLFRKRRQKQFQHRWDDIRLKLSSGAASRLPTPAPSAAPTVIDVLSKAALAAGQREHVHRVRTKLEKLPDQWELHEQLAALEDERLAAARALFETHWKLCVRNAPSEARSAAGTYRNSLERLAQGTGGSAMQARALIPKVLAVFPVWGVTNLSARTNLPLEPGLFDLVVIDEASQCDVPSAIPLLYRAKHALIIGDRNQLIHVSSLRQERDRALAQRHDLDNRFLEFGYRDTSLFALANQRVGEETMFLEHHFRSHPAIITFSNDHFYGSRLTVLTPEQHLLPGPAVRWIEVEGRFRRGSRGGSVTNLEEAQAVGSQLQNLWPELHKLRVSVGIVAPYRAQVEAIRRTIARLMPEAVDNVTVDTAHRFQGDERDVIIYSPTISRDMPDFHVAFASNPNLVNVAITRARSRLLVVGDRKACLASPGVIAALATYVTDLEEGGFESPLERRIFDAMKAAGLSPQVGVEVDGYRLDLAIETPSVRLDIECDGAAFHRDRRRDVIRDAQLENTGWRVLRFGGVQILRHVEECVERIKRELEATPSEPPANSSYSSRLHSELELRSHP